MLSAQGRQHANSHSDSPWVACFIVLKTLLLRMSSRGCHGVPCRYTHGRRAVNERFAHVDAPVHEYHTSEQVGAEATIICWACMPCHHVIPCTALQSRRSPVSGGCSKAKSLLEVVFADRAAPLCEQESRGESGRASAETPTSWAACFACGRRLHTCEMQRSY